MGKHRSTLGKNKVNVPRADVVADRECVDILLHALGYPPLLSKSALESLIHRERKTKEARERHART